MILLTIHYSVTKAREKKKFKLSALSVQFKINTYILKNRTKKQLKM